MLPVLAFVVALVFGLGLAVSGLTDPSKVIGFLDVTGAWYPGPLVVIGVGVAVYAITYRLQRDKARPILSPLWLLPTKMTVDRSLVVGALLFGTGWGLAGFCPGPALVGLAYGKIQTAGFVVMMFIGAALADALTKMAAARQLAPASAAASPVPKS